MDPFVVAFTEYVKKNGGDTRAVADKLRLSVPTVKRWLEGRNLPHGAMKGRLMDFMAGKVK